MTSSSMTGRGINFTKPKKLKRKRTKHPPGASGPRVGFDFSTGDAPELGANSFSRLRIAQETFGNEADRKDAFYAAAAPSTTYGAKQSGTGAEDIGWSQASKQASEQDIAKLNFCTVENAEEDRDETPELTEQLPIQDSGTRTDTYDKYPLPSRSIQSLKEFFDRISFGGNTGCEDDPSSNRTGTSFERYIEEEVDLSGGGNRDVPAFCWDTVQNVEEQLDENNEYGKPTDEFSTGIEETEQFVLKIKKKAKNHITKGHIPDDNKKSGNSKFLQKKSKFLIPLEDVLNKIAEGTAVQLLDQKNGFAVHLVDEMEFKVVPLVDEMNDQPTMKPPERKSPHNIVIDMKEEIGLLYGGKKKIQRTCYVMIVGEWISHGTFECRTMFPCKVA